MSANRVVEASGSSGAIQVADSNGGFSNEQKFVFDLSNKRLGVGTSSPTHKIHVVGDVSITGSLFAREYHTELLSSSIIYSSGSSKFGDTSDDLHQFTGSAMFKQGLSGSLTRLPDGKSYLQGGNGVTIVSSSNGQIIITATAAESSGDITSVVAGTGLDGGATSGVATLNIDDDVVATVSGTQFSGQVGFQNAISVTGSLIASGSSSFGNALSNLHQFTGTVMLNPGSLPGSNVAFYVSGTQTTGSNPSTSGVSVFGGDVVVSGTLFGGSPIKFGSDFEFQTTTGATPSLKNPSGSIKLFASEQVKIGSDQGHVKFIDLGGSEAGSIFLTGSDDQADRRFKLLSKGQIHFHGRDANAVSPAGDVWFFVSGAIAGATPIPRGAALFGGDVVVSGTIKSRADDGGAITGSITRTRDGKSYLMAGANVTITSASDGQVVIASSGGGSSTIGAAEDSDYSDGLFSDFTSSTSVGTAIDKFNEVLKALAPDPAPDLDDINSINTGVTGALSFGSSNDQSSATPPYITVAASAGLASAVDVNGAYTVTTSSNNLRLGIFDGDTHVSGILNEDISSNSQGNSVQNYPSYSFGNGDTGVLRLNVNGSVIKEIDLTSNPIGSGTSGLGTGSYLNAKGSGFNFFSAASTGTLSNGNSFASFKHRTGKFVIASGSQRSGWNYARITHVITGTTKTTNYLEWVNDDNSDTMSVAGSGVSFTGSGSIHLSGVEYFQSGTAEYKVRVSKAYKYVYDTNDIRFTTSNSAAASSGQSFTLSTQSKPTINTGAGENHNKVLHLTASSGVTADYFISGALTAGVNVTHPIKSNLSNSGQATTSGILMYNLSNSSTALVESFRRENYRIVSGTYSTQASLTTGSNSWDSTKFMTASNGGHSNGLQFYNQRLYSPTKTLLSGDFRDNGQGGSLDSAPADNPNYSGQSGQRTFYRWFKNETGSTKYDLSIAINGSGAIVSRSTSLSGNKFRVFIKFPSDGTRETGWLDLATEFVLDSYADNNGCHTANGSLSFDTSLNATNYVTLGTVGVGNNEYISLRIEADASWTGYISQITISFGGGTGSITAIPDLDDIDCNDDGTDSNLSFGSSKSISGYTNVGTAAGFSAADVNALYETDSNSNNLRRSVFALDTIIEGDLNEDVSSNSNGSHVNHVANSFSDANSGSLKLEVNGSVIHTVEITGSYNLVGSGAPGSGTGTSFNGNGSGFFSLSTWEAAEFNNGVPYYLETYRTGKYRVVVANQRLGWNYARVIHTVGGSDRTTNYVEWVNDSDSNALSAAGVSLQAFQDDETFYLSGVKYFVEPSGSIVSRVSNIYKNVYSDSASAISFTSLSNASGITIIQSGSGLSSTKTTSSSTDSLQTLNTTTDSQSEVLHATGTIQFSRSKSLSGSYTTAYNCAGSMVFVHPLKTNLTLSTVSTTALHVYSASDNSNANTIEYFNGEKYRIQSGSYSSQASVTTSANNWSSTGSMNDNGSYPGYYTGLMLYDGYLITPLRGGNVGDFRNHSEGGSLEGPASNVNYSSPGKATREYYRGFLNNTSNDRPNLTITLRGSASIVGKSGANSGSLGTNNNVYVEVRVPGKSGFMDLGKPSAGSGNTSNGDGCLSGDLDASIDGSGASNVCTFNGLTVDGTTSGAEYFVLKLSAHKNWTGYVSQINVAWSS